MKNYTYHGSSKPHQTIIYIHGGGHVMGSRDDLPSAISDALLANNNALITLDYPLAPQMSVPEIILELTDSVNHLLTKYQCKSYILMGRSSGANLILSLDPKQLVLEPQALITFYGYASDTLDWMNNPIKNLNFKSDSSLIDKFSNEDLSYSRDLSYAYPYYYTLRKTGLWPSIVGVVQKKILWRSDIPIFIAHSIFDPDVPYHCASTIRNHFINNTLHTSTSKQHAFDHDPNEQLSLLNALDIFMQSL